MNLAETNYNKTVIILKMADGTNKQAMLYSYETHGAIYDVLPINGALLVRKNMGSYSDRIDAWSPIHYAICGHFNLH